MDLFDLFCKISIDLNGFEQGLENAKSKFDSFSDKLHTAGEKVSSVGSTLTKGLTLPLAGIGTAVIKTGMDYEAGMSKVQAISGATGDEMDMLGEKAMEMAAKTKFSTADSAEAYQYMAMAGWKAGDMVDGLTGIMNLAAASGENLGTTSDIVTDALTAFGLKASDSGRFADVLAAASNNANTNVSMLGESFKYVAPVAGAMGYSVEDTSIALGLMANSGIKASQAGTSLRTAITNMAAPTKNMAAVMDEYGISLSDADGEMLSFAEIMEQLRNKMGGLDEATQSAAAAQLFGKEAMSGMLAIINAAPEDFDKLTDAIKNSAGTTEEMASIMQDNAAGAFDRLKSAVDVLFTKLSGTLLPIFTQVVEKITEWVNWFGELDESTQKTILTIAGIAAAVGPVLIVVGKIITAISAIAGALSGIGSLIGTVVGAVTGGISTIIGIGSKLMGGIQALFGLILAHPVVAVVAAIIAAVILLWQNCEAFRDAVKAIWDAIVGFFRAAADGIKAAFDGVVDFFRGVWDGIQSIFATVAEVLGGFFESAASAVQSAWESVVSFFQNVWASIQDVFSAVADVLGGFFRAAWDAIQNAWSGVAGFFSGVWESIQGVFSSVAEVLSGFFKAAWEAVKGAWEAAKEFFSGIAEGISSAFSSVSEFISSAFSAAWEAVRSIWEGAKEFFAGLWSAIQEAASTAAAAVGNALKGAWDAVKSAWDTANDFFKGIFDKIVGIFKDIGGKFKEIGGNIVKGIKDGVLGAWESFTSFISDKIKSIVNGVKDILGIHSPSRVFAGIGENMALGLADGWDDEYRGIQKKIESGLDFGSASVDVGANYNGTYRNGAQNGPQAAFSGMGNTTVNIYSPEAVDAVEAAREWQKTAQRMALGYV